MTVFESKDIPLEVALSNKNNITIYVNGSILKNQNVNIKSARGLNKNYKTDSNGMISNLKIRDLRQGITVTYNAGNNQTYVCSYIVESNKLFTPFYFEAQKPMLYCCLLSAVLMKDVYVAKYPQFNGSIGAAIMAKERGEVI
nr:hypothetical protein [uncultured Intestinibacter sp.]